MIQVTDYTKQKLYELRDSKNVYLEGNVLKIVEVEEDDEKWAEYVEDAIQRDKAKQRKRLEITRHVQKQNDELQISQKENTRVNNQLTKALEKADESKQRAIFAKEEAERARTEMEIAHKEALKAKNEAEEAKNEAVNAKKNAENNLEVMQKKTQFELIGKVVKVALWVILGVGGVTTAMYIMALIYGVDTAVIGSTWSNIIGILLTNSFSIIGTIMGVKYATEKKNNDEG